MKLGIFAPLGGDPALLRDILKTAAMTAEEAGFHSIWFPEHVVLVDGPASRYPYSPDGKFPLTGSEGLLEPFGAIMFAAAVTERIRLGTGICLVPQRPPVYTAKHVADCDVLSGGRVDFGVGIGWLREEFDALGADFDDRAHLCREYLSAMISLWTEDVSSHDGRHYQLPPVRMFPKPIQKPHPPIVFGGESTNALRRVADLGQGWFGYDLLPGEAGHKVKALGKALSQVGRPLSDVEISVSPYLKPARDADALEAYKEAGVDQVILLVLSQTPDAIRAEILEIAERLKAKADELAG